MATAARRGDDRIPPHNIEAEESVLGAALLDRHAADVVATLDPGDFYAPKHRPIAAAIRRLVDGGHPVDHVTVGEELRRTGELDLAGGATTLHTLIGFTPAVTAAPHYADIVRDAAALRRLLYVAADISQIAYTSSDPAAALLAVTGVMSRLEAAVDPTQVSTLEIADIAAILATDLEPEQASILTRSDGVALLYPGKMHMFQAEPTAGKSWIGCFACVEALAIGGSALWIDYEDTPRGIVGRMVTLGCDPAHLGTRFRYVQPIGAYGPAERARLEALVADLNPDVIIIDGVGEALQRDGLSEDKAPDVVSWVERMPRPLARTGAAVVMIDHVVKNREEQGRWARGSGAKLGVIDGATYQLKVSQPFSRTREGKIRMVIAKDRPGGVGALNETAAIVTITPHGDGARVVIAVDPNVEGTSAGDPWKPTHIMARVSRIVAESSVPLTATAIRSALPHSKPKHVADAVARLVTEGYIAKGKGRTPTYTSIMSYDDPDPIRQTTDRIPPADVDVDALPFDTDAEEPAWMTAERREAADRYATDPEL